MKRFLSSILILIFSFSISFAQTPVVTQPYPVNNFNGSGSITTLNTFQQIFAQSVSASGLGSQGSRSGCLIQNNGTHTMYIFYGPIANATTPTSLTLAASAKADCNNGGGLAYQDQISITGTANDQFFATQQ